MNSKHGKLFLLVMLFFLFASAVFNGNFAVSAQERVDVASMPISAAPMWQTEIGGTVRVMPDLRTGSAVFITEEGNLRAFFMSGLHLWDFDARENAVPFIARSWEAATYVSTTDGIFRAINRVGRELWRLNLGRPISHPPVIGWDGRVFIPAGSMVTCRTASGNALWTINLDSPIAINPILDRTGSFVTVLENNDFIRINQFSYVETLRLSRRPLKIISLDEGNEKSYILFHQTGEMEKIYFDDNANAGAKLSRANFTSLPAPPVAAASLGAQFVVTLRDGRVLSLNAQGRTLWTRNSHEAAEERGRANLTIGQASMLYDERGIYAITTRGVSAFTPEGRRRFVHRLSVESSSIPAFSDEGVLFACGIDNILRVYKIDEKPRTVPINRFYGIYPEGTYGMGEPPPSPWARDRFRFDVSEADRMYAMISEAINSGNIGKNEPAYVAYIMEMVGFFIGNPQTSVVRPDVSPTHRVRLINLLARIGSRETIPFLWNIFDLDQHPAIRRACADAIGFIGVDPTGRSFHSYNFLLSPNNPNADPQLVVAATSSIARLSRFIGPPISLEGIRVLRHFSLMTTLPNAVRAQIRNELDGLFREGLDQVIR